MKFQDWYDSPQNESMRSHENNQQLKSLARYAWYEAKKDSLDSIEKFYEEIKHGDEEHQRWLRDKFNEYFGLEIKAR